MHIDYIGSGRISYPVHSDLFSSLLNLHAVAEQVLHHFVGFQSIFLQTFRNWKHVVFREEVRIFRSALTANGLIVGIYQIGINLFVVFIVDTAFEDFKLVQEQFFFVVLHIIGSCQCCIIEGIQGIFIQLWHLDRMAECTLVHRIDSCVRRGSIIPAGCIAVFVCILRIFFC
ncbi:hypothetical protein D3C75_853140 [compost metagenome]